MVDIKAAVYDGKDHPVDSKDIAFQIAARNAFKEACRNARPVLLEPVMTVEISIPTRCMGDITSDLNGRRGRVMWMDTVGDAQIIKATVPLAELTTYSTELRSITAGEGSFSMEFSHHDVVPAKIQADIVAKAKAHEEPEEE
jgi:elongation factor G